MIILLTGSISIEKHTNDPTAKVACNFWDPPANHACSRDSSRPRSASRSSGAAAAAVGSSRLELSEGIVRNDERPKLSPPGTPTKVHESHSPASIGARGSKARMAQTRNRTANPRVNVGFATGTARPAPLFDALLHHHDEDR